MTEEQIKQKAKEWIRNQTYTEEVRPNGAIEVVPTKMACFIGGYTEAMKELQEQIEKLKRCENCKYGKTDRYNRVCDDCLKLNKWELAE